MGETDIGIKNAALNIGVPFGTGSKAGAPGAAETVSYGGEPHARLLGPGASRVRYVLWSSDIENVGTRREAITDLPARRG